DAPAALAHPRTRRPRRAHRQLSRRRDPRPRTTGRVRTMTLRKPLLVLAAALALTACGSIGGPKIAIKVYDPETRVRVDPAWPQVDWSLSIGTTAGIEALDSVRIA